MAIAKKVLVKKAATPKKQPKAEAPAWNTIHIFGYGESQVIGINHNGKIANSELKALAPLLAALAENQQKGTKISLENTHAINIFNNAFVDFLPKQKPQNKHQRFAWGDVNTKLVQKLSDEILAKAPQQKVPGTNHHLPKKKDSAADQLKERAIAAQKEALSKTHKNISVKTKK